MAVIRNNDTTRPDAVYAVVSTQFWNILVFDERKTSVFPQQLTRDNILVVAGLRFDFFDSRLEDVGLSSVASASSITNVGSVILDCLMEGSIRWGSAIRQMVRSDNVTLTLYSAFLNNSAWSVRQISSGHVSGISTDVSSRQVTLEVRG